jgi:hypothetical protein
MLTSIGGAISCPPTSATPAAWRSFDRNLSIAFAFAVPMFCLDLASMSASDGQRLHIPQLTSPLMQLKDKYKSHRH